MWQRQKGKKYGNTKVQHAGITFDSQLEKALFDLLSLRQRGGEIRALSHHPGTVFLSAARIQSRPDFRFELPTGEVCYAESKGFETPAWRIKRKLWLKYGPGKLEIYKGTAKRLSLVEVLSPSQSA